MDVFKAAAFFGIFLAFYLSSCDAIQHGRNLIWAQSPSIRLTVSRLVCIEGDPSTWVPAKKPSVKHISAPHYGWEFKALGFSYNRQMLVWSEAMNKKIQALFLNGSTETIDVFVGTSAQVHGLAVDWVSDNVYWTDAMYNWVMMAPLRPYSKDRVYTIVVKEGLDNPHGIAVHPQNNWLFLSDWGVRPRIERMDPLGRGRTVLVEDDMLEPRGLTLDLTSDTLFWVDSRKDTVESVYVEDGGLAGGDLRRRVIRTDMGTRMSDIAVFNDYVFLTDQSSSGLLKVIHQDDPDDVVSFTLGNVPYGIVMYDEEQQPGNNERCSNLGCEHMCVDDALTGPQCLCGEGSKLMDDSKSCVAHSHFIHPSHLYAIGVAICWYPANIADMSLDNVSLTSQCFLSDRYGYLALTFDAAANVLYYSGNYTSTLYSIPLERGAKASVIASATGSVKGMALDWVQGLLYWTDATYAHIKVARRDGRFQRVLLEKDVNNPLGIAVHPHRGRIYWTDIGHQPDVLPKIESANMDGSEREILMQDNLGQPNHLFIDYNVDRLYWADSILNHIREYDLETRAVKIFFTQTDVGFYGLSLFQDYLLWTDTEDMNGIHMARMDTQRKVRGIIHPNYGRAADLITVDRLMQPNVTSPCSDASCDQLCLPKGADNYTCSCGLGFELVDDSECNPVTYSSDNFLVVSDAYQRNVYHINARNGVIAALTPGEAHEPIAIELGATPTEQAVYWSDNSAHVIRRKVLGPEPTSTFIKLPEESVVDGLALDSQNRLLFYTDTGRDIICVVAMDTTPVRQAVVVSEDLDQPRDIVVSPATAMMYWSDWGDNASISEARMNGDDRDVIISFNHSTWPNALAIDVKGQALYWADAQRNEIGVYALDSRQHRILLKEDSAHYFGLFVMGDFLYVTDWKRRYVARMHKHGGELMRFGEDKFTKLYGITGFNSSEIHLGGPGSRVNQSAHDNTTVCLPHRAASVVCVCVMGYSKEGPVCRKTPTTTAAPIITTTTHSATSMTTTNSANTATKPSTKPPTKPTDSPTTTAPVTTTTNSATSTTTTNSANTATKPSTKPPATPKSGSSTPDNLSSTPIPQTTFTRTPTTPTTPTTTTTTTPDHRFTKTEPTRGVTDSNESSGEKQGHGDDPTHRELHTETSTASSQNGMRIGIIVASVLVGVALIAALVIAGVIYFRRRRGYTVPHSRLNEDRFVGDAGSGSGSPASSMKVSYADDAVHFDEGFENPTYEATMAMLAASQPSGDTPHNT